MNDNIDALIAALPDLRSGVFITLQLTVGGVVLAFVIAIVLGLAARSPRWPARVPARVLIEFFRGTSLLVQLFWFFYVMPLFGIKLDALLCGVLALGLNYGAYAAEVVRGSINSVPKGQWEAATALSLSPVRKLRKIIWPQAWAIMIPSLANLAVMLLKGTAVAYIILMHDLTWETDQLRQQTGNTFFAYGVGMIIYFLISYAMVLGANALERHAKRRLGQGPPKGGLFSVRITDKATTDPKPAANAGSGGAGVA
ncbi:ectoine/hydroxyectoine ABC transporter permease subunit EhuC [Occultella aeris]|uniref:Inner membrane amino-acid ABC transporter permease protein YecS n=1 Tax=Occultella aeris TaxID=2761496 RepID=A0A7M4DM76_9MICO|nr:ectoine/hydroxyectoine ABC transporter permease subunit EhuC [Occultella aeris]VZO38409.1 Inner membrane amino-acid ABC transporter permease protein YecS [Occultella aeris]